MVNHTKVQKHPKRRLEALRKNAQANREYKVQPEHGAPSSSGNPQKDGVDTGEDRQNTKTPDQLGGTRKSQKRKNKISARIETADVKPGRTKMKTYNNSKAKNADGHPNEQVSEEKRKCGQVTPGRRSRVEPSPDELAEKWAGVPAVMRAGIREDS